MDISKFLFASLFVFFFPLSVASAGSVVINEILFDPVGTDTGLEAVEIYNSGQTGVDLSGWELYPDGVGYYTFSQGFNLAPNALVVVHLRASGIDSSTDVYHPSASANMGNSSGSLALFSGEPRGKDTIQSFVRYHSSSSASPKTTWETAASDAGLWTKGEFLDISNFAEGSSVGLMQDGIATGLSSWKIYSTPTMGSFNNLVASPQPSPPSSQNQEVTASSETNPPPSLSSALPETMKANAGSDKIVLAGQEVIFSGKATDLAGKSIDNARFLWNFGDGVVKDGKVLSHAYLFPGKYMVSLNVSSGEDTASDYAVIDVLEPKIIISEVVTGQNGFIELSNETAVKLDISGLIIKDAAGSVFPIPRSTFVEGHSVIVFPNSVTSLLKNTSDISLALATGRVIEEVHLLGNLAGSESFVREGKDFIKSDKATPGAINPKITVSDSKVASKVAVSPIMPEIQKKEVKPIKSLATVSERALAVISSSKNQEETATSAETFKPRAEENPAVVKQENGFQISSKTFLVASIFIGILGAAGIFLLRKII